MGLSDMCFYFLTTGAQASLYEVLYAIYNIFTQLLTFVLSELVVLTSLYLLCMCEYHVTLTNRWVCARKM